MHCECLRPADWPPWEERKRRGFFFFGVGLMDGAGLAPMLLWTEWVSGRNLCFPGGSVRMGQDGSSCLSVWHQEGGGVSEAFKAFDALGLTL